MAVIIEIPSNGGVKSERRDVGIHTATCQAGVTVKRLPMCFWSLV